MLPNMQHLAMAMALTRSTKLYGWLGNFRLPASGSCVKPCMPSKDS